MNASDLALFNEAVRLAQSGQTSTAYTNLNRLAGLYPNDTNVLLWLVFTAPAGYIAQQAIAKIAQLEPHNPSLPAAQQWLAQQEQENTLPLVASVSTPAPRSPEADFNSYSSVQTMQAVPLVAEPAYRENTAVRHSPTQAVLTDSPLAAPPAPTVAIVRLPPPIVIGQPPALPQTQYLPTATDLPPGMQTGQRSIFSTKGLLIGGIGLGLLIVAVLVFLLVGLGSAARLKPDVARKIDSGSLQSLSKQLDPFGIKAKTTEVYLTPQSLKDTRSFYDIKLKQEGWQLLGSETIPVDKDNIFSGLNPIMSMYSRVQDKAVMIIMVVGPVEQATIQQWETRPGGKDMNKYIKAGESFILLVEGDGSGAGIFD